MLLSKKGGNVYLTAHQIKLDIIRKWDPHGVKTSLFALQYSPSQRSFHIESVNEMLETNLRGFYAGTLTDYIPIAISEDLVELERMASKIVPPKE